MSAQLLELPRGGFAPTNKDLAASLRTFADMLEDDTDSDESAASIRRIVMVLETTEQTVHRRVLGCPTTVLETIGLLHHAATLASVRAQDDEVTGDWE